MSTDQGTGTNQAAGRKSRRRIAMIAGAAGLLVVAAPVAALGLTGSFGSSRPSAHYVNKPIGGDHWSIGSAVIRHGKQPRLAGSATDYHAYVALAGAFGVAEIDVATDKLIALNIGADSPEGVAVTPDGKTVFAAQTGQFSVESVNAKTNKETPVTVGAFPQDVAVSPDGTQAYVTVTGGDTGPGGSDTVAVIATATSKVVGDIKVGTAPRQVLFSPDGSRAYVTTETGIYVIDTATRAVISVVPDPDGPQGMAISPDGSTLYVTNPNSNQLWAIDTATGKVTGKTAAGEQPYSVTITPSGADLYVADMNSNSVRVIATATGHTVANVKVGSLPMSVAATPDGSQVWVGNGQSGTVSVISTATNTVTTTILGGEGTFTIDIEPLGIAFAKVAS